MLPADFEGTLTPRQVAERSNLEKELNARSAQGRGFPKTIEFEPLKPEGNLADAGPLEFNQFDSDDGWLTVAWDRQQEEVTPRRRSVELRSASRLQLPIVVAVSRDARIYAADVAVFSLVTHATGRRHRVRLSAAAVDRPRRRAARCLAGVSRPLRAAAASDRNVRRAKTPTFSTTRAASTGSRIRTSTTCSAFRSTACC